MFDLIIIGGGPGGYELAEKAAKKGLKTAVIEKERFGGTCVTVGCIPSKAFLHAGKIIEEANHSQASGISNKKLTVDQKQLKEYKDKKVDFLVKGAETGIKRAGGKIFKGYGKLLDDSKPNNFKVSIDDKEIIEGTNVVIATGSEVFLPPIPGLKEGIEAKRVITSTEALDLEIIPKDLSIIGGGVIGLELGSYFQNVGSNVSIIEIGKKIAGVTDSEISSGLKVELEKRGMNFLLEQKIEKITDKEVILKDQSGKENKVKYDKLLIAAGRRAVTTNIGLENLNVYIERGAIVTDDHLQTNIPGLFAIGDVNGKSMLAHTAYREGEVVLDNILGKNATIDYDRIPSVIYTHPEVAEIGITEDIAKQRGIEVEVKKLPMLYSGRFVIENDDFNGLLKVIIKKDSQEIIGLSIFGSYASEIIIAGSLIVGRRMSVNDLWEISFAHPTVGEIIKNAVFE